MPPINAFTLLEKVTLDANGSLGVLSIPTLGERDYKVTLVKSIGENDWSYLGRSAENKLTLITCISGKPTQRLVARRQVL